MSKVPVYVETQKGMCMAHVLDVAGTFVRTGSIEEALARLPEIVRRQMAWLRGAEHESHLEEPFEFEVVETFDGTGPFDPGDPAAIFSPERQRLTLEEMRGWLDPPLAGPGTASSSGSSCACSTRACPR